MTLLFYTLCTGIGSPIATAAPIAAFFGSPTTGVVPLDVTFTDTSTGSPTGWAWYFGEENFIAQWTQMNASAGWSARHYHSSVAMPDGSIVLTGGYSDLGIKNDVWRSTDMGATWTQMTDNAGWSARWGHSSVAIPDGSIVVMGGYSNVVKNDVWRSTDNGATWTQMTDDAEWPARAWSSSVAMPDGSIVLMGGCLENSYGNDVWRSTDNGATWTQMTDDAGWSARSGHSSVALPDGSIVVMGGAKNDVWRSTDNGATWTQMTDDAGWSAREGHSSVALPDGSIVFMGGDDVSDGGIENDVWRSTDNGATWTQMTDDAGWSARSGHSCLAMPDGSIVLIGGRYSFIGTSFNDVWRFTTAGSSAQNPSHAYTLPGTYPVALQVYNSGGWTNTRKTGYIIVTGAIFKANITSGPAPLIVGFTDQSTGDPTTWAWDFGDNTSSTLQNPVHVYSSEGSYTVNLTVTNSAGSTTTCKVDYVTVYPPVPVASFSGSPRTGLAPLSVLFTDNSTGSPIGWAWFFGDENFTAPWTQLIPSAGWSARYAHSSAVLPDGSIVLMGGLDGSGFKNDVWRSTDNGATWTQMNVSAEWSARSWHNSVAMQDGSIVLMGGWDSSGFKNDVWRSTDNGATWTEMTDNAGWSARHAHSSVVMPDGSIVLMGGNDDNDGSKNDVWRSTDNGATWTQMTSNAGWSERWHHSSVGMMDGSIVLMGGRDYFVSMNDVWRSTDNGATWTQMNASAGWSARYAHSSVVMPDGSIVLMGGADIDGGKNDVWRSTDNGVTWMLINASAEWSARSWHSSVAMPNGSIVLIFGYDDNGISNDVWQFMPAGSSAKDPAHTYTLPGTYQVTLQVFDAEGYFNSARKTAYITALSSSPTITSISPAKHKHDGKSFRVMVIGTGFWVGATGTNITLNGATYPNITGTKVKATSSTKITCYFKIPKKAKPGFRNVTVTNPYGQFVTKVNGFKVMT